MLLGARHHEGLVQVETLHGALLDRDLALALAINVWPSAAIDERVRAEHVAHQVLTGVDKTLRR